MSTTVPRQRPRGASSPPLTGSTPVGAAQAGVTLSIWWTTAVAALVAVATTYGLVVDGAYRSVDPLVEQTWRAQDAVTLALLPVLVWAARRAAAGSVRAHLVWLGLLMWVAYCYAHLAFGAPFNDVFLVYVAVLALSGFGLLDGLLRLDVVTVGPVFARAPRRAAAWFLIVAGLGIAGLWLSDIAVELTGGTPANLHLAGLPNPTWVLDLGWLIPMAVGAAVLLRRRHEAGPVVATVLLVMLWVLSVAMLAITPFAVAAGLGDDPSVASQLVVFTVLFVVLAAVETGLLVTGARGGGEVPGPWLRRGWWPGAGLGPGIDGSQPARTSSSRS
ncbi:MAG TPA: hypothetical protein VK894_13115 [Jiangellales bacterium]|nr:hypothetical protein [Jiangellales bacterium]